MNLQRQSDNKKETKSPEGWYIKTSIRWYGPFRTDKEAEDWFQSSLHQAGSLVFLKSIEFPLAKVPRRKPLIDPVLNVGRPIIEPKHTNTQGG